MEKAIEMAREAAPTLSQAEVGVEPPQNLKVRYRLTFALR